MPHASRDTAAEPIFPFGSAVEPANLDHVRTPLQLSSRP